MRSAAVVVAPYSGSMSSVWLREGEGSLSVVFPDAPNPASNTAVLSCAEDIGASYSIGLSSLEPCSVMGRVSAPAGSKCTPIFIRGAVMRRMGRLRSDSSPVISTVISHGASAPIKRRAVVPELPQSRGSEGCDGPSLPQPVTPPNKLPSMPTSKFT